MMNNRIPEAGKEERRTLSVLVDNKPGVLSQIARLFTRNGYNIESFAADTVLDPGVTRITIEVIANDNHTNRMIAQLNKMVNEENQLMERSKVAIQDQASHQLGATFHEWLVFKNTALSLDRTVLNFQLIVNCSDGKADVQMTRVSYDYELERDPTHYTAEEWISDKYAVNKKRTKLLKLSAKFRRKTIDRKDFIFNKFTALLNEK